MRQGLESEREMSNLAVEKSLPWRRKKKKKEKAKQEVIYLDPFSPIKPWEAGGRSGKTELSLQEIKHEMKTSSSYSVLSSQAPISHSRPLIKWCPVSALRDEFWLCSCRLEGKGLVTISGKRAHSLAISIGIGLETDKQQRQEGLEMG